MRLLDRHIGSYVVKGTLLSLLVLVGLFTLTEFVEDLGSVGKGAYTMPRAIEYMIFKLPGRIFQLFPEAALIGSLMGLGILATNSELAVVRAAGVSTSRICLSVMKAAGVLMIIALFIGEVVAPACEKYAQERRSLALSQHLALKTGGWLRDGSTFIEISEVQADDQMANVSIYEFDKEHNLRVAARAQSAVFAGDHWQLEGLKLSEISEEGVRESRLSKAAWKSELEPELVDIITENPESRSVADLLRYFHYLEENGLSTTRHELALWGKFVHPLAVGVMIFLAIPLVLGMLRTAGLGLRVMIGIFVGIIFYVAQQTAVQMGILFGLTPFLSAFVPTALFFAVGLGLIRRVR